MQALSRALNPASSGGGRKGEVEGRAVADRAFRPDAPAVTLDDSPRRREANSVTGELVARVKTMEGTEQLLCVRHIETRAVVTNVEGRLFGIHSADLNSRRGALAGELPGVANEIFEKHAHEAWIGIRFEMFRKDNVYLSILIGASTRMSFRTGTRSIEARDSSPRAVLARSSSPSIIPPIFSALWRMD